MIAKRHPPTLLGPLEVGRISAGAVGGIKASSSGFDGGGPLFTPNPHLYAFAKKHGLFYNGNQLPYDIALTRFARELRKHATAEERKLWRKLKELPTKVLRQRPIAFYIVDFYLPHRKLVIELDGGQHYTETGKQYDKKPTSLLEEFGLRILRFSNVEINRNINGVMQAIIFAIE